MIVQKFQQSLSLSIPRQASSRLSPDIGGKKEILLAGIEPALWESEPQVITTTLKEMKNHFCTFILLIFLNSWFCALAFQNSE